MPVDAAYDYSRNHELHALLVQRGDELLCEHYANGHAREKAHVLYSGTKSFWGIAALAACEDGILDLDEPLFGAITARMLLNLTAGYGFGGLGSAVPTYERALTIVPKHAPGTTFTYGGIPLQVFGAQFARKLTSRRQTPHEYLRERILEPAGVDVA